MTSTQSTVGLSRAYELEAIRDQICGLFGQDCYAIYQLHGLDREHFESYANDLLEAFDEWVAKYEDTRR